MQPINVLGPNNTLVQVVSWADFSALRNDHLTLIKEFNALVASLKPAVGPTVQIIDSVGNYWTVENKT